MPATAKQKKQKTAEDFRALPEGTLAALFPQKRTDEA